MSSSTAMTRRNCAHQSPAFATHISNRYQDYNCFFFKSSYTSCAISTLTCSDSRREGREIRQESNRAGDNSAQSTMYR